MSTKDDYVAGMNARLTLDENKMEGTFGQDIINSVGYEMAVQKDTQIDPMIDRAFVSTANGDDLDLAGADNGLPRKEATYSQVPVRVYGLEDQVVSSSVKISYGDVVFTAIDAKTIPASGYVDVNFICNVAGTIGNVAEGTVFNFDGNYYGLTSAVAIGKGVGGADREDDESYRERILYKIQNEASSGNEAHYKIWAESVDGVASAKIVPLWNGNGTVKVLISTPDKSTPTQTLIDAVAAYIETQRPIGATVTVDSIEYVNINVVATVTLSDIGSISNVTEEFNVALASYLSTYGLTTVSYLRIADLLLQCTGVLDVQNYTLNGGVQSITLTSTQMARVGTTTIREG